MRAAQSRPGAAVALFVAAAWAPVAGARPVTLDDTLAFGTIESLDVSPDGGLVVLCVERHALDENRFATDIFIVPADGSRPERQLTRAVGDDCAPRFRPDGQAIAFLSDRSGSDQIRVMPVGGGEAVQATAHAEPVESFAWSADGRSLLFTAARPRAGAEMERRARGDDAWSPGEQWRARRLWSIAAPAAVGVGPAAARSLTDGTWHVTDRPFPSPDGSSIALLVQPTPELDAAEEAKVQLLEIAAGAVTDVPGSERAAAVAWSGATATPTLLFTRPFDGLGWSRLDLFAWKPGDAEPRNVSAWLDRDIEQIVPAQDGGVEILYSRGAVSEVARVGPGTKPGVTASSAWRPGYSVAWPTPVKNGRVFVRLDRPHEVWRTDQRGAARPITRLNSALAVGLDLPGLETVRWKSGEFEVEGVLTVPSGPAGERPYPLLVRPHGGPRAHTLMEFDPQSAWLASLGYLVLQPNFRGSTGYGDAFAKGNGGDWGTGPFADVMAGVDALVAAGRADPKRLYLFGWSYGGIMANWAAAHSDRFRAIVSGAGVADLRMQYILSDARRWRFDYFGGSPFLPQFLPAYEKNSPVTETGPVTTPVLFIQGEADRRCPLPQALMMHRAILDRGGQSELVIYPREGHGFREPEHILDRSRRIAAFFAAHGGPASPGRN